MPGVHPPPKAVQIDLFHPPRQTPSWQTLPSTIREQTLTLLAQLLRVHPCQGANATPAEERNDE
jgi:hypothetical protein